MNNESRKIFLLSLMANDGKWKELFEKEIKPDIHNSNNQHYLGLLKFMGGQYNPNGSNYHINAVTNNKIWVSKPTMFNDPFDCLLNLNYTNLILDSSKQMIHNMFPDDLVPDTAEKLCRDVTPNRISKEVDEKIKNMPSEYPKNLFISCFSELSNLNKIIMWSHYANQHQGFCAEYSYREINNLRMKKDSICPVAYCDTPNDLDAENIPKQHAFQLRSMLVKSTEWSYEKEWRLCEITDDHDKVKEPGFLIPFVKPVRIYLGYCSSKKLQDDLRGYCQSNQVELWKMNLVHNTFKLQEEKIELNYN